MKTNSDYTLNYKIANTDYGEITVPKGTRLTHRTALGIDKNYHFVDDLTWIDRNYPTISRGLKHDVTYYGINVPREYVDYEIIITE